MAIGAVLGALTGSGAVKSVLGGGLTTPPKTIVGKLLGKISGRTENAKAMTTPAKPIQTKPLASGSITFGKDQNKSLLGFGILAVLALAVWRGLGLKTKRRRR
jgi:hypothetical protein